MEGFQIFALNKMAFLSATNKVRKVCSDADREARKYKMYKNRARYLARKYSKRSSSRHRRRASLATLKALARMSTRYRRAALARMPPRARWKAARIVYSEKRAARSEKRAARTAKNCKRAKKEEVDMKARANKI